uniref:WSSV040 n=1 Tax=White spot syndrome virus TaxID=342409 RepID=A0A3G5BHN6_9VIRU|nr:WSSV040 [White spot syndrome virus]
MSRNSLRVKGLKENGGIIPNPFDPLYVDTDAPFGMAGVKSDIIGKGFVESLLPGEISSHYNTFDCFKTPKKCRVGGNDFECISCRSLGGGTCVKSSRELKTEYGIEDDDEYDGVCVPLADTIFSASSAFDKHDDDVATDAAYRNVNPFTTVEEAYLHYESGGVITGGGKKGTTYITKKRGCVDSSVVRKDPSLLNKDPRLEPILGCTDIVLCGGKGVGRPIHPTTFSIIDDVDDIDFDISSMTSTMDCLCEPGYSQQRDPATNAPKCEKKEGGIQEKEQGLGCPVMFRYGVVGDTGTKGCLCDESTQIRLEEVAGIDLPDAAKTDYAQPFVEGAKLLLQITERYETLGGSTKDACLPRPGNDTRMSALGYSYAASLFGRAPEITAFNGGHLITGGLLRESAMDAAGNWHSRIEDSDEQGKLTVSESVGGVVPYSGTGSVAAHIWNGDALNDNGLVGAGGGNFTEHPNASLRVVPLPHSNIPGLGIDSIDHAVGIIASQGKIFPETVHMRAGDPSGVKTDRRDAHNDTTIETSFLKDSDKAGYDSYKDNPLQKLRKSHDSGICATAYVVPSLHRVIKEKPSAKNDKTVNKILPLVHYRPTAKRMAHTPIETIFKHSLLTAQERDQSFANSTLNSMMVTNSSNSFDDVTNLLLDYFFPNLNGEGKERSGLPINTRSIYNEPNNAKFKEIGGIILQPVTAQGAKKSSTFARFSEKILSTNSPKIIDHYKAGSSAVFKKVGEKEAYEMFAHPPTAWRIASNEGTFFSGRGLNNGIEGTGMREAERVAKTLSKKPDIFAGAILTGDGVLMNGASSPLVRPMEIPASSLPEHTWFERRSPVNARGDPGSADNLTAINNTYDRVTKGDIRAILNSTTDIKTSFNSYAPARPFSKPLAPPAGVSAAAQATSFLGVLGGFPLPIPSSFLIQKSVQESVSNGTVGSMHGIVPLKFHEGDELWQQCEVKETEGALNFIPPPMALFESLLRVRTLSSETFIRPELIPNRFRADWGLSPHTAGHYLNGVYSPPCVREETGQSFGYPCSGALSQYTTMMVPKPLGPQSHSSLSKFSIKSYVEEQTRLLPANIGEKSIFEMQDPNSKNIFDKIGELGEKENCNCTNGLFCPKVNGGGRNKTDPIAATPSRGNRHSRFPLMTTLPKNDVHLSAALLRAQSGDARILNTIGETKTNGRKINLKAATENIWDISSNVMLAPNKFCAMRRSTAYTPYSTRQEKVPAAVLDERKGTFDRNAELLGDVGMTDIVSNDILMEDYERLPGVPPAEAEIFHIIRDAAKTGQEGAKARRIVDFFESSHGVTASTFNVGTFSPYVEGVKDIVSLYATPCFTDIDSPTISAGSATINEGASIEPTDGSEVVVEVVNSNMEMLGGSTAGSTKKRRLSISDYVDLEEDAEVFTINKQGKATENLRVRTSSSSKYVEGGQKDMVGFYEASKRVPRVMRRVHVLPVLTPYHGGFESCAPTAAQSACTRGVEITYADFMRPSDLSGTKTTLEGVRVKGPEPFDDLSTLYFRSVGGPNLRKFAHHHHFGYEGLMSRYYYTREKTVSVSEGDLKDRFPFVCQSDRGPFPPKRDGTIQPLALVDMGVLPEGALTRRTISME